MSNRVFLRKFATVLVVFALTALMLVVSNKSYANDVHIEVVQPTIEPAITNGRPNIDTLSPILIDVIRDLACDAYGEGFEGDKIIEVKKNGYTYIFMISSLTKDCDG